MKSAAASTLRTTLFTLPSSLQQWRGIRVRVRDGNLEQALAFMQRKMQSSGIERLIKQQQTCHVKDSEKRVLASKSLQRRIQSDDLARKLKTILLQKVRLSADCNADLKFLVVFLSLCSGLGGLCAVIEWLQSAELCFLVGAIRRFKLYTLKF
ncbi:hypothetical protein AKJ16_DCAP24057 [Drosera capensis]